MPETLVEDINNHRPFRDPDGEDVGRVIQEQRSEIWIPPPMWGQTVETIHTLTMMGF